MTRTTHDCPSCAAPLGVPDDHERFFTCAHCGTVIEDRGRDQVIELAVASPSAVATTVAEPVSTGSPRIAVGIAAAMLAFGGLMVFLQVQADQTGPDGLPTAALQGDSPVTSISAAALVSSDDDTTPDLVVSARRSSDETVLVYLDEESADGSRWETPSLDARTGELVVVDDVVVVSSGDRLALHDRRTGAQRWEARPPDTVQHSICTTCVRGFGDVLVALSSDGTLVAIEPDEGTVLWQRRLVATPRQVLDVGGLVGVIDEGVAEGATGVLLLDPTTGAPSGTVPMSCLDPVFDDRDPVHPYDHVHELDDGGLLLLAQAGPEGCVARWDPGATAPSWETVATFDSGADFGPDTVLHQGPLLVHAEGGVASSIDTVTGTVREVARSDEHDLHAWAVSDGVLVLAAASTRGSRSWELWGVDLETAQRLWVHELAASTALQLDAARRADDAWFAVGTIDGVTVGTLQQQEGSGSAPVTLTLQTLPARSGTAGPSSTVELPASLIPSAFVVAGRGNDIHLVYETGLWTVDVGSGTADRRL